MVADYFTDTRELLRFWLETKGCRVVEAMDGQEAIELAHDGHPDLILMSLRMPIQDGLDVARRIREHIGDSNIPIVAMSAYPTKEVQASALAAGCTSFIPHPIDFNLLGSLLSNLLPKTARASSRAAAATRAN
jgi:CheY-like chemotaxis protein